MLAVSQTLLAGSFGTSDVEEPQMIMRIASLHGVKLEGLLESIVRFGEDSSAKG